MLDWDKPLSQQAPDIQKSLDIYKKANWISDSDLGKDIYMQMGRNPADRSSLMRNAGIPGIRYLDGGSRAGGAGTSNYVLFPGEENALTMLTRNGQAVPNGR